MSSTPSAEVLARYEAVIGLEVHAQLLTRSKAFSPESAAFGAEPNTHVDVVSLGHPGTLPVLNAEAVTHAVRMGLATGGHIAERSVFARKHYFYPDLPKGYQISQYETPLSDGGYVDVETAEGRRRIRLTRIHLEEDAGKSVHDLDPVATLMDYNRCGVPLIEIVSEPDVRSPEEAGAFLRRIRQLVRYLGICDGNMEEGSLRCDANVSVRLRGATALGTKAEVKNLNSIRHVERAVEHEIARQVGVLEEGGRVVQETRLWDPSRMVTRPMRSKEEAHDYRYFPDPDLPPVVIAPERLEALRASLPELPEARRTRYVAALGLPPYDAGVLTEERAVSDYFEAALAALGTPSAEHAKAVSNAVMGDVLRTLNERACSIDALPITPERLAGLVRLRLADRLSSSAATTLFDALLDDPRPAEAVATERNLLQVSDEAALRPVVEAVVAEHPAQAEQFRAGTTKVIGFLVGQVMRRFEGAPDPKRVRELLEEALAR